MVPGPWSLFQLSTFYFLLSVFFTSVVRGPWSVVSSRSFSSFPLFSAFSFYLRRLVAADEPEGAEGEGQQEQRAGNQRRRLGNDRQHDSVNDAAIKLSTGSAMVMS